MASATTELGERKVMGLVSARVASDVIWSQMECRFDVC